MAWQVPTHEAFGFPNLIAADVRKFEPGLGMAHKKRPVPSAL
jgi:hypothetical protein